VVTAEERVATQRDEGVRARVIHHLKRILAAGAATGALSLGQAGAAERSLPPSDPAPPPPPRPMPGPDRPIVCDPLPAPIDCSRAGFFELRNAISATAAWTPDAKKVIFYARGTYSTRGLSLDLSQVTGARAESPTNAPGAFSAWLVPEPGARAIEGVLAMHCAGGQSRAMRVRIELVAPGPNASMSVTLSRECGLPWTARDVSQSLTITSRWVSEKTVEVVVRSAIPGSFGFKGSPRAQGAAVVEVQTKASAWAVLLEPAADSRLAVLTVPVVCGGVAMPLDLELSLSGPHTADQAIAVQPRVGR
jgi:hypothetical protein